MDNQLTARTTSPRLLFIDALRAFAILMMLQGHFISTTLGDEFRDPNNVLYAVWNFMRGLTAPIFFTVTGLVFVYLLSGNKTPRLLENQRWIKGIRRGFMLIGVGYLLRINFFSLLGGHIGDWSFQTDVLHCIGLAILFLCGLFAVARQSMKLLTGLLFLSGLLIFFSAPLFSAIDTSELAKPFSHYVNKSNGAIFSPLPWIGYSCFGGLLGLLVRYKSQLAFQKTLPLALALSGLVIHFYSSSWWMELHRFSGIQLLKDLAYANTCFMRLGQTMFAVGLFIWFIGLRSHIPHWVSKTGSETLSIYAAHYVILYGTWFGLGINYVFPHTLSPLAAILGASAFVLAGILLSLYAEGIQNLAKNYRLTNLPKRIVSAWR